MRRLVSNPWIVCLTATSFFFYQFFQITVFNVLIPDLVVALNTDSTTLSLISSLYFYGNIIFLLPAGVLLDNLSPRLIILLAMSLSLIGLVMFVSASSVYVAGMGRFLLGISGGPFCFLGNMRLASRWFPPERMAFVTGVIVAVATLGGVIAQMPFAALIDIIGWRNAMWVNIGFGVLITIAIYLLVYDYPLDKKQEYLEQLEYYRREGFVKGLKTVILRGQNWFAGIFASLLNLPIFGLGALWGMMFLMQIHHTTRHQATVICSLLFFGMLIGAPFFGFISDNMRLRKIPMLIGAVICFAALVYAIECEQANWLLLASVFFLIGFGSSSQVLAYPVVAESNPLALAASSLGLASTLIMSGGAFIQPLFGAMIEWQWLGQIVDGVPVYNPENYKFAFWTLPITVLISMIMVFMLRETHCRSTT